MPDSPIEATKDSLRLSDDSDPRIDPRPDFKPVDWQEAKRQKAQEEPSPRNPLDRQVPPT